MLKKISKLFLGLVVCAGSAYVTPTYASSASSVVLVHIQAAGQSSKDEFISIYNNTPNEINITDWCISNKSQVRFACFETGDPHLAYYLPGYSFAVVASEDFVEMRPALAETSTIIFEVTNQSSGSIVNSNDTISLRDAQGAVVDSFSWSVSIPSGKVVARAQSVVPYVYETVDPLLAWSHVTLEGFPVNQTQVRVVEGNGNPDESPNPDPDPSVMFHPEVTEVLPNPSGSDVGNEFIELYNPNADISINLSNYKLRVGAQLEKSYTFPSQSVLQPLEYKAFSNSEIKYTLLNSSSSIQLEYNGIAVGTALTYDKPKDGLAWARIAGEWKYTPELTPGAKNPIIVVDAGQDGKEGGASSGSHLKPCAANQYRSPETNRCRLIASDASKTPKPCASHQYRNPETNRCRNIVSAGSTLAPCKEGKERSPETNRCRTIVKMTEAKHDVKGVTTTQGAAVSWYLWAAIGGIVALIAGYGIWEWREELRKIGTRLKDKIRDKFAPSK